MKTNRVIVLSLHFSILSLLAFGTPPPTAPKVSKEATQAHLMDKLKMLQAQDQGLAARDCRQKEGVSLAGYDPVSYFKGPLIIFS